MRRLFIIRKDLQLTAGKLAAMVAHCAEAYWTNMIKSFEIDREKHVFGGDDDVVTLYIPADIMDGYVNDKFTKTICEAKNLIQLMKAETIAVELGLKKNVDYGYINDACLTELTPENEDGTCTVGIWFKPLDDDIAHQISKKFQLYKG